MATPRASDPSAHESDNEALAALLNIPYLYVTEGSDDEDGDEEYSPEHEDDGDEEGAEEDEDADDQDEYEDGETEDAAIPSPGAPVYTTEPAGVNNLVRFRTALFMRIQGYRHSVWGFEDDPGPPSGGAAGRNRGQTDEYPAVPSEEGTKLMCGGTFGGINLAPKNPMMGTPEWRQYVREIGQGDLAARKLNRRLLIQSMLPTSKAEMFIYLEDPVYSGQFSADGSFFFACGKDFKIRLYDTSSPYNWKYYKTVTDPWGRWTITDASLSPDNELIAYSSIHNIVHIAPTSPSDTGEPHPMVLGEDADDNFGIWSIRLSKDKRELIAGTNKRAIVVYDIPRSKVLHTITGHSDDVNAVCYANPESSHIIYSGSDDATIKVWDRRSMGDGRPAAAFVGHCEGLTYIDSKGDGRYILSNSKDQTMKLWDMRMAMSFNEFLETRPTRHTRWHSFDYRFQEYNSWFKHPNDNSIVTFRGHSVLRTLIRCHFSPPHSSDSRYVYSGSQDGKVYVWNLDATLARVIDVHGATGKLSLDDKPAGYEARMWRPWHSKLDTTVRDASWHPYQPIICASSWNGWNGEHGSVSMHTYAEADDSDGEEDKRRTRVVKENMQPVTRNFDDDSEEED